MFVHVHIRCHPQIRGLVEESLMNKNVRQLIQNKGLDEKEFDGNNLNEYKKVRIHHFF